MQVRLYKLIGLLTISCLLSACLGGGASTPIRYYLLDPAEYDSSAAQGVRPLSIEIIDLQIPQYLERFHIATRRDESCLKFSECNQWGENLRKNLLRTMARNLSFLLTTIDIGTPLNRSSSQPDYRIQIHIEQFEQQTDGKVKLVARWQLSTTDQSESLGVFGAEFESQQTVMHGDYDQMVAVMRLQFGELSKRVADSIIAQEK